MCYIPHPATELHLETVCSVRRRVTRPVQRPDQRAFRKRPASPGSHSGEGALRARGRTGSRPWPCRRFKREWKIAYDFETMQRQCGNRRRLARDPVGGPWAAPAAGMAQLGCFRTQCGQNPSKPRRVANRRGHGIRFPVAQNLMQHKNIVYFARSCDKVSPQSTPNFA